CFVVSVSQAKTVHTAVFLIVCSSATGVNRSVRLNTFRPGVEVLTWFRTYIYLLQFPGYTKEVFAKSFSANRDHAHPPSLHRRSDTRRGTGPKSGIIRRPPANHVPGQTIPAGGRVPDTESGWEMA